MEYTLITGASDGIGYEFARGFSQNAHNLILVARQEDKLKQIAEKLREDHQIKILIIPLDLSQHDAADKAFQIIQRKSILVNYLINNAGFYVRGPFSGTSWEREQEIIQLQCLNHTKLVKLFLPEMLRQGKGGILNVCSTGSFTPGPYNAIYCAAKSFVLSFSEALAQEVTGSGVTVTALCPGGTKTSFQDLSKRKSSVFNPLMDASIVAKTGYRALMKGKRVAVPGFANKMQVFVTRFLPRRILTKLAATAVDKH